MQIQGRIAISKALHLAKRFFQVLCAKPLTPAEQREVAAWLRPEEALIFWSQPAAEKRHGLATARPLAADRPGDHELIRAGLLHDVGKAESGLGPFGRTYATLAGILRLPTSQRHKTYLDHGPVGATALGEAGAEPLVVTFAKLHPQPATEGIDQRRWELLLAADDD